MIHTKGKTFTIERSKWLRGEGSNSTLLREEDGKMCCLGQILRQCGISDEQLGAGSVPGDIELKEDVEAIATRSESDSWPTDTREAFNMIEVNDDIGYSPETRESRLSELAQQAGFSLKFVD